MGRSSSTRTSDLRLQRDRRGATLIETLLAMAIMVLLVVGILQMFVVSLNVTKNAAARTQLVYKAQQVAEALRWMSYQYKNFGSGTGPQVVVATGAQMQVLAAGTFDVPNVQSATGWGFWGPSGMNIIEGENAPYKLSYQVVDNDSTGTPPVAQPGTWGVIVTAIPIQVAGTQTSGQFLYQGSGIMNKRVQYVTTIKK